MIARKTAAKLLPKKPKAVRKPKPVIIPDELDNIGKTHLTDELFRRITTTLSHHPKDLPNLLSPMHPADIADVLERLTRNAREKILPYIPLDEMGEVISELETGAQEHVLNLLEPQEVKDAISELDSDDAADLAQMAASSTESESGLDADAFIANHQQKRLLEYETDSAGGLMQLEVVTVAPDDTVTEVLSFLRDDDNHVPDKPGTMFVVDAQRRLVGTVSISRLVRMPLSASMEAVMRKSPLMVTPDTPQEEVVSYFEKYDLHNLAVVNARGQLLGRITIDDILDVVMEEASSRQARAVGLDESEDLFAPAFQIARHRMTWLIVNLFTAIAAAAVIALFEGTIAKLTTLAVLMPIVTSMGGNATTQTQTVIIRGMALHQITRQNIWTLLVKEFTVGAYNGILLGFLIALGTLFLYHDKKLALVIALATVINHFIAALGGWVTPLFLKKFNFDPAIATGVITTTFTDVGGFFAFLGLATLILL